jgi:hypothetical protein
MGVSSLGSKERLVIMLFRLCSLVIAVGILFPTGAYAVKKVTKKNIQQFELLQEGARFACFRKDGTGGVLGKISARRLRPGVEWKAINSTRLDQRLTQLNAKIARLEERGKKKRKLKKLRRKQSRLQKEVSQAEQYSISCGGSVGSGEQFTGNPNSLLPYRERITDDEISHLLKRVAFGGNDELREIGRSQGLTALVNALVDGVMSEAEQSTFDQEAAFWHEREFYFPEDTEIPGRIWTTEAMQIGQMYRFLYSRNPLHEWMLFFLSTHFATNLNAISFSYSEYGNTGLPHHWNLLRAYSTGNLEELLNGFFYDPAMNVWLDNKDNTVFSPNQNYARELLELFALGAIDPVTGEKNYDEESIVAATAFVSGYFELEQTDTVTGRDVIDIDYRQDFHDSSQMTLFRGIPGAEITGMLTPQDLVHHVLYNHSGSARYLAERLGGRVLYPGLSEAMVSELANNLRGNGFDLGEFVRTVLRSSAMFSEQARNPCIASPLEQSVQLARKVLRTPLPREGEREEQSGYLLYTLVNQAGEAGQRLFEPPSVFGWKGSCNLNRNGNVSRGEGWVTSQLLLNRSRACAEFMNMLVWQEFDFVTALGLSDGMNARQVVEAIAEILNSDDLHEEEIIILADFLTHAANEDGQIEQVDVSLTEDWYVYRKIPRLVCLIEDVASNNMR